MTTHGILSHKDGVTGNHFGDVVSFFVHDLPKDLKDIITRAYLDPEKLD